MPSSTFERLNHKKRARFLQEAYKEFSINTYQGASITNLVKTLAIAKGSVYQYFKDKEELYRYLVEETMHQLNTLLDKTCVYENEEFFTWYNKLLIVQVKYLLSFPAHAIILRNVMTGVLGVDQQLKEEIIGSIHSRIHTALAQDLFNNDVNMYHLTNAPLQVFDLVTSPLNIAKIISSADPVFLDSEELMAICSEWVGKLKSGL